MEKSTDSFSKIAHIQTSRIIEKPGLHQPTASTSESSSLSSDSVDSFSVCSSSLTSGQVVCHDSQYSVTVLNTSLPSHVKDSSTFVSTGIIDSPSYESMPEQKTNGNQLMTQHVLIGNLAGANLMPSTISAKQCANIKTSSTHGVCGQVMNVVSLPVFLQGAGSMSHVSGLSCLTSSGSLISTPGLEILGEAHSTTCKNKRKKTDLEVEQNLQSEPPTKIMSYSSDLEKFQRTSLSSADTVIITSASLHASDTLPVSSLPHSSPNSNASKTSVKDMLSLPSEKPFSFMSNISDKSVSLESIPTISLFKPEPDENMESGTMTTGNMKSENSTSNRIAVVGDDKIPQSIILFLRQKRGCNIPFSQDKDMCSKQASKNQILYSEDDPEVSSQRTHQHDKRNESIKNVGDSDTDTEIQDEEKTSKDFQKTKGPSRSDTLLLDTTCKDEAALSAKSKISASDTFILQEDRDILPSDKSSGGFSINSSISLESPASALIVQADESAVSRSSFTQQNLDQPTVVQTPIPLGLIMNDNLNKSFYTVTSDGQLSALRCIGSDQLDISVLSQLGLLNSANASSQNEILPHGSLPANSSNASRIAEAKETQTDLVLGTRAVYFKFGDSLCSNIDQYPTAILAEPISEQASSASASNASAVSLQQSHARGDGIDKFHGTVISLENSSSSENPSSSNLESLPADGQCIITTPGSSNPPSLVMLSPSTLPEEEAMEFKCKECQESFKSKQELNAHGKTHKKVFKCDLCNASFTRMGNYTRHRKIHNLQPESQHLFKCNKCGREFLQRCDLKRHLLIHSNQEPHRCEKCGKGYIRHSDLVVHMRFHNKDKAFKCNLCDKRFFQTGDLSRHVRRSHKPVSLLTCGHCERKYACETTLIRHMKAVHKDIILNTVNQRLQESDQSDRSPSVNTKDVLFTMTQKSVDVKQ